MNEEISLVELLDILKKNIGIIVKSAVVFVVAAVIITLFFLTPKYEADTQMLVNQSSGENNINVGEIQTSVQMITTYKEFIMGDIVLEPVADQLGDGMTAKKLKDMVEVFNTPNSQVFTIRATSRSQRTSAEIANLIASTFQQKIQEILEINNVTLVSKATKVPNKVSPNLFKNIMSATIVGVGFSFAIIILKELLDTKVHSESDLQRLGFTILGSVNEMTAKELKETRFKRRKLSESTETGTVSRRRRV